MWLSLSSEGHPGTHHQCWLKAHTLAPRCVLRSSLTVELHGTCHVPWTMSLTPRTQQWKWGNEAGKLPCTTPQSQGFSSSSAPGSEEGYCSLGGDGGSLGLMEPQWSVIDSLAALYQDPAGINHQRWEELYDPLPLSSDMWWGVKLIFYGCWAKLPQFQ